MIFRVRYNILDGHVYFHIEYGVSIEHLGFTGVAKNIMKLEEFRWFRGTMERGADHDPTGRTIVEFRPDTSITA